MCARWKYSRRRNELRAIRMQAKPASQQLNCQLLSSIIGNHQHPWDKLTLLIFSVDDVTFAGWMRWLLLRLNASTNTAQKSNAGLSLRAEQFNHLKSENKCFAFFSIFVRHCFCAGNVIGNHLKTTIMQIDISCSSNTSPPCGTFIFLQNKQQAKK